jgi:autotransporter-associated beta strand protein
VSSGAALQLQNNITVAGESLTLNGSGVSNTGALRSISGNNEWTGNITLAAAARIASDAGLLTISGNINAAGAYGIVFQGFGNITVSGVISSNAQFNPIYTNQFFGENSVLTLSGNNTFVSQMQIQKGIVSVSSIKNFGVASGLGAAASSAIQIGATSTNGSLLYTGAGDTSNRTIQIGSNTGTPLAADTGSATIQNNGSGALVFNAAIFNAQTNATTGVGADRTLTLSGSNTGNNTISGVIQNNMVSGTGTGTARIGLIKNGVGTWILSGNNTYNGTTTINAGTLQIGAGGASGALSTSSAITNNGTLVFNRSGTLTQGTDFASGISGTGNLTQAGPGNLIITAANSYTGATTVANGTLTLSGSGTLGTSTITITGGTLDLGGSSITNTFSSITGGTISNGTLTNNGGNYALQNGTVSANLAGTNGLTKTSSGTLTLNGTNSYSGDTTISAGNLSISSASALLGTSGINLADATALIYTGGNATLNRAISVTGGTGTIRNTGGALTLTGGLTKNGTTLTFDSGTFNVNTVGISGSAANSDLVIDGATVNLNIANTYNGPTRIIDGGTLNANFANALPTANGRTAISIDTTGNGSSTLALGANQSIASLNGASTSTVTLGSNTLTIGTASGNTSYAGRITGSSSSTLVKDGASTLVLSGNNTGFAGTTTIIDGTLQAAAAGAMGNSTVINVTGGSFLVTAENAVNDTAAINLGGGRMAVSGTFNETVGALTLSANSTIDFSGFVGTLRFSGVGSWAAGANLAIWNWSGQTQHGTNYGTYPNSSNLVFTNNSTLSSNLANISFYSDSGTTSIGSGFERGFTGGGTEIIAVPETETYFYAVALLAGVVIQYLRRQAKHREGHRPAWPKFLLGSRETTPAHHPAPQAPDPHPAHKGARSSRA